MLTYSFDNLGEDSLYEHLYKCIRQDITDGVLTAGSRLPSKNSAGAVPAGNSLSSGGRIHGCNLYQ